jgi:hypothetical protein
MNNEDLVHFLRHFPNASEHHPVLADIYLNSASHVPAGTELANALSSAAQCGFVPTTQTVSNATPPFTSSFTNEPVLIGTTVARTNVEIPQPSLLPTPQIGETSSSHSSTNMVTNSSQPTSAPSAKKKKAPPGSCYTFWNTGRCDNTGCTYKHVSRDDDLNKNETKDTNKNKNNKDNSKNNTKINNKDDNNTTKDNNKNKNKDNNKNNNKDNNKNNNKDKPDKKNNNKDNNNKINNKDDNKTPKDNNKNKNKDSNNKQNNTKDNTNNNPNPSPVRTSSGGNGGYQWTVCKFWNKSGQCTHGEYCKFNHGPSDTRLRPVPKPNSNSFLSALGAPSLHPSSFSPSSSSSSVVTLPIAPRERETDIDMALVKNAIIGDVVKRLEKMNVPSSAKPSLMAFAEAAKEATESTRRTTAAQHARKFLEECVTLIMAALKLQSSSENTAQQKLSEKLRLLNPYLKEEERRHFTTVRKLGNKGLHGGDPVDLDELRELVHCMVTVVGVVRAYAEKATIL